MGAHRRIGDLDEIAPTADLRPLGSVWAPVANSRSAALAAAPGLVMVAACVGVAFALHDRVPSLSPLVAAVAIGAVLANVGAIPAWATVGLHVAARRLLRVGVVLLGLRLAVGEVLDLGPAALAVVAAVVVATFFGTQVIGRWLGVGPELSLLTATGFSICGASAIAAMEGVAEADEEEVAFSIALVTLCGSLAIVVLPLLAGPLGLRGADFGTWVGASVHDVAQVVATSSGAGATALTAAVLVKLTRVVLLAPLVAGVSLSRRRRAVRAEIAAGPGADPDAAGSGRRPPVLPLFVVGFLLAIALRSTGVVPPGMLEVASTVEQVCLAAALVGLGAGVRISKLRRIGGRPLLLGAISWVLVAGVAWAGVAITGA